MAHVHFIGFRGDEYVRAARVFGFPDFVHMWHDARMMGDVADDDVLVFANKEREDVVREYSWQDHENW